MPVLDVEKGAKIDDNHNVEWCLKWLDLVGRETNSTPMVYTAKWAYDLYLMKADKSELAKLHQYPIWWARYIRSKRLVGPEQKLKGWSTWDVWQYTGHGTLAGAMRPGTAHARMLKSSRSAAASLGYDHGEQPSRQLEPHIRRAGEPPHVLATAVGQPGVP